MSKYHVVMNVSGYLPDNPAVCYVRLGDALFALGDMLTDWADDNPDNGDAAYAAGMAEILRGRGSAELGDIVAHVGKHGYADVRVDGDTVFEIVKVTCECTDSNE